MAFRSWSDSSNDALNTLRPQFALRHWSDMNDAEKDTVVRYFLNKGWFDTKYNNQTFATIQALNEKFKVKSYGRETLNHGGPHYMEGMGPGFRHQKDCCYKPAQTDAIGIMMREHGDVVYEMLSIYADHLDSDNLAIFRRLFNDISEQFHLNILMSEDFFVPKQDAKITKEIYDPVLVFLSGDKKWSPVSNDLRDSFSDYFKSTPDGYSSCVTHAVSALQAFLQIQVHSATGKGNFGDLLKEMTKTGIIQENRLAHHLLNNVFSVLMKERQAVGDPHPKDQYEDEKGARLTLNLVMSVLQTLVQQ